MKHQVGEKFEIPFPFTRTTHRDVDEGGWFTVEGWRPGGTSEPDGEGGAEYIFDGEGLMLIEIVGYCELKPPMHNRIMYIRTWQDPNGKIFGKKDVRMISERAFPRFIKRARF